MVRSKEYFESPDISISMFLYAKAANTGHIRSINTLALAFWDPSSWLYDSNFHSEERYPLGSQTIFDVLGNTTLTALGYNPSNDVVLVLPGAADYIILPTTLLRDCSVALMMFKFLAEHSYRIRDISRAGYESFMFGDLWAALDFYDEASELGSSAAQENAAYIYEILMTSECEKVDERKRPQWRIDIDYFISSLKDVFPFQSYFKSFSYGGSYRTKGDSTNKSSVTYLPGLDDSKCTMYYKRMAAVRRLQSSVNKEPSAIRRIADDILVGEHPFKKNSTVAISMYRRAAEMGDVHSLMNIAWLFRSGTDSKLAAKDMLHMLAVLIYYL